MQFWMDLNINWFLLPLIVAISIVYSATRYETWSVILRHSLRWSIYVFTFLGITYIVLLLASIEWAQFWLFLVIVILLAHGLTRFLYSRLHDFIRQWTNSKRSS